MFKKLLKKISVLFLVILFSGQVLFADKILNALFKKYEIFYVETLAKEHEKVVLKVIIRGIERACLCFLYYPERPEKSERKFKKEYHFLNENNHKNIIRKIGSLSEDEYYCIFTELADCDLAHYRFPKNEALSFGQKIKILKDIISGIDYMHSSLNIIHGDLKPKNVVIFHSEDSITAKLIDFTYSKPEGPYERTEGTPRFMSPEYLLSYAKNVTAQITKKFDIFSFGVLMYNIFYNNDIDTDFKNSLIESGYSEDSMKLALGYLEYKRYTLGYIRYLNRGGRPFLDDELVDSRINDLISRCWATSPRRRPTAFEILEFLEAIEF